MALNSLQFEEVSVGAGEVHASGDHCQVISAIGLGSCVGVVAFDPKALVGGIAHVQLPGKTPRKKHKPSRPFADAGVGIPELLNQLKLLGASVSRSFIMLTGGAQINEEDDYFKVGLKNQEACARILKEKGLVVHEQRVGGGSWRSVKLYIGTGQISIRSKGGVLEILNIPGVTSNMPKVTTDKLVIKNGEDLERVLSRLVSRSSVSGLRKKNNAELEEIDNMRRVLTHITQQEIEFGKSDRRRTKIASLEELKQVLAQLTGGNAKIISKVKKKAVRFTNANGNHTTSSQYDQTQKGQAASE